MRLLLHVFAFCSLVAGLSSRADYVVHERRPVEPTDWVKTHRPNADKVLSLRIGLAQQNLHELEEILMSVSNPDSTTYGKHWPRERVVEHFAPREVTIDAVKAWLIDSGFHPDQIRVSQSKGWINVKATVSEVESLLDAEYHIYTHPSGHEQISCASYSVPYHIREHVDLIKPTVHFRHHVPDHPALLRKRANSVLGNKPPHNGSFIDVCNLPDPTSLDHCDKFIHPKCLQTLYSMYYTPKRPNNNSYGIVEFMPESYLPQDLDKFSSKFFDHQNTQPKIISIPGGFNQNASQLPPPHIEADLDFEYGMGLTYPTKVSLLNVGEGGGFEDLLDAAEGSFCEGHVPNRGGSDQLPAGCDEPMSCNTDHQWPNVVSVSYTQDESSMTVRDATHQCFGYGKLGLMGITVVYASGDNGVAGARGACLNAKGDPVKGDGRFNPPFPSSCNLVTTVGATQINPGSTVYDPESACERRIFSGGGFSNIFPMPDYQKQAVDDFFNNYPPPYTSEQFNNTRKARGFPDLSANGADYVIVVQGECHFISGTSASTPVIGAMITLLNDGRLNHNKSTLGFINPLIYHSNFSSVFHDITNGSNAGCGTPGFNATKGWDPVTGLGTINMTAMMQKILELP